MTDALKVTILGVAQPQGSKRSVGKGIILEANEKLRPWRELVTYEVFQVKPRDWPVDLAYSVHIDFFFARPKGHYGTGRNAGLVKSGAPEFKTTMPDLDKLIRAILDSCTDAGVWRDDAQVITVSAGKLWSKDEMAYTQLRVKAWER